MEVLKLHKRSVFNVYEPDDPDRINFMSNDARDNAIMVTYNLLKDEEFKAGDKVTVDVRILIERKSGTGVKGD
jgi:hypothetical protein